jgi:excisionase family DNA binding protein
MTLCQKSRKEQQLMQRLISVKEAATYTGLSPYTIYTMVSQRRIPFVRVGRLVKFDEAMLQAWIKQHTVMPMPPQIG